MRSLSNLELACVSGGNAYDTVNGTFGTEDAASAGSSYTLAPVTITGSSSSSSTVSVGTGITNGLTMAGIGVAMGIASVVLALIPTPPTLAAAAVLRIGAMGVGALVTGYGAAVALQ